MKNLFNEADKQEVIRRLNTLTANTQGQWGKMTVAQMLRHCTMPLKLALANPKPPRQLLGILLGPFLKSAVIGPKPFKKNGFTPPQFKIESREDFNASKHDLLDLVNRFTPSNITDRVHPFFGSLGEAEWGESQYKHLNHHLTQFGV